MNQSFNTTKILTNLRCKHTKILTNNHDILFSLEILSCPRTRWTVWTIISRTKLMFLEDKWYYQNMPPDRHSKIWFVVRFNLGDRHFGRLGTNRRSNRIRGLLYHWRAVVGWFVAADSWCIAHRLGSPQTQEEGGDSSDSKCS